MRTAMRIVPFLLIAACPLDAQTPAGDLARLSFMTGCWTGPTTLPAGASVIEERFTAPSENVMLGTARYLASSGRTLFFEFKLLRSDSTGTWLVPYPDGRVAERPFRLTRLSGDTALFESPEHPYPRRIRYHRDLRGVLVARVDAGPADSTPHTFSMRPTICSSIPDAFVSGPGALRDRPGSGTTELIVFETVHGLFLGVAIPIILGADDEAPYGLGLLLGGPVGLMASRAYARAHWPTAGQARAIVWGGTWGALSSLFLYEAFEDQPTTSGAFGALTAGLVGGTLFGGYVARNPISGGDGSLAIHSTVWGGWVGLALSVMINDDVGDGEAWAPMLIGGNAALLAASIAARNVELSSGRVWIITAAGLAGLVAGVGVDILVQPDDAAIAIGLPLIGSLAGLAGGVSATRNYDANRIAAGPARLGPLLAVHGGRARFNVPLPEPALVPRDDGTTRRWVPGLRLRLFDLRH